MDIQSHLQSIKQQLETPKTGMVEKRKDYNKSWAFGVKCFQTMLNKERSKEGLKPVSFIAVRQRLVALKEIDELRWFYNRCLKYSWKKDAQGKKQSFGKIFWGATRLTK